MNLRDYFNRNKIENRVEKWVELDTALQGFNQELDILSEEYHTKKNSTDLIIKSEDVNEQLKETVHGKWDIFFTDYVKDLGKLKKSIDGVKNKQGKLEKGDPLFKSLVDNYKKKRNYDIVKKAYKDGDLTPVQFDNIMKAVNKGPVKYSDVIVWLQSGEGTDDGYAGNSYGSKILILRRRNMEKTFPGDWGIPGGHVDYGEDFKEAGIRELFEETGLKCKEESFNHIGTYKNSKVHIEYFETHLSLNDQEIILDEKEHGGYELVTEGELFSDKYTMPMNMKENLEKILRKNRFKPTVEVIKKAVEDGTLSKDDLLVVAKEMFKKAQTPEQSKKIEKVMKEFKDGTLKSSSGEKVTERSQAIAIALSEAGLSKKKEDKKEVKKAEDDDMSPETIDKVLELFDMQKGEDGKLIPLEKAEKLEGGKADGMSLEDLCEHHDKMDHKETKEEILTILKKQFELGKKEEKEHTDDESKVEEIVKDHLKGDLRYYTKEAAKVEKGLTDEEKVHVDEFLKSVDGEITDEQLTGFLLDKDLDASAVNGYFQELVND